MKALLIAVVLALAACATPPTPQDQATLTAAGQIVLRAAIRHGVSDYLTKHPGSAARAKGLVDGVLAVVNGDATTTVGALKEFAYAQIPASFAPADAQDARDVIDLVAVAVQGYVGNGQLNAQALVDIRDVLGTISYVIEHPGG